MTKIPKPIQRGQSYRIHLMIDGQRYSCTRDTARECEQWAAKKILESKASVSVDNKSTLSLNALISNYIDKVSKNKKGAKIEYIKLQALVRNYPWLVSLRVVDVTPQDLTKWRNDRQRKISDATVLREISLLRAVFSYAVKELFIINTNPFTQVSKPKQPPARKRRISDDEIESILLACDYQRGDKPTQSMHYIAWSFLFCIETAIRRGELLSIKTKDIHPKHFRLHDTKNGSNRDVPMTNAAITMLTWLDLSGNKIVPLTVNAFKLSWQRAQVRAGVVDLNFHDTRHEAASRLALKLPVHVLAKITGHKDINTLQNTYYNPTIAELTEMLNAID